MRIAFIYSVMLLLFASQAFASSTLALNNLSVSPSSVSNGMPITIAFNLANQNANATSNITVSIWISRGAGVAGYTAHAAAMYPFEDYNITAFISNSTQSPGTYNVTVNASYSQGGRIVSTQNQSSQFTVVKRGSGGATTTPGQIAQLLITMPIYYTITAGTSGVFDIGLKNSGPKPEIVHLTIPRTSGIIISENSVYLFPNESIEADLLLQPSPSQYGTTYLVPINYTVTYQNNTKMTRIYATRIAVPNSTYSVFPKQIDLINYTSLSATIAIQNPSNSSMQNLELLAYLPIGISANLSGISTSGAFSSVNQTKDLYVISGHAQKIPAFQSAFAYYTIENSSNPYLASNVVILMSAPSNISGYNILRISNAILPGLYTNTTSLFNVSATYAGTTAQNVTFTLTSPQGLSIPDETQNITMYPNERYTIQFRLNTGLSPGVFTMQLYAYSKVANVSYYLPVAVFPGQLQSFSTSIKLSPEAKAAIVIFIIIVAILGIRKIYDKSRYSGKRAEHLFRIKKALEVENGD